MDLWHYVGQEGGLENIHSTLTIPRLNALYISNSVVFPYFTEKVDE